MSISLVVLAAGMGSRYGGLKQMDGMGPSDETVLEYSVFDAIRAGFNEVIFIIREDFAEAFQEQITAKFDHKISVKFAYQALNDLPEGYEVPEGRKKPWGTAHALRAAREIIQQPFVVINADDFYGAEAYQQIATFFQEQTDESPYDYAMVGYPLTQTLSEQGGVNRGLCQVNSEGFLENISETLEISEDKKTSTISGTKDGEMIPIQKSSLVSLNFWAFQPSFIPAVNAYFKRFMDEQGDQLKSESFLPVVIDEMIHAKQATCKVLPTSAQWLGVTYPEDKDTVVEAIQQLVDRGVYPTNLWTDTI